MKTARRGGRNRWKTELGRFDIHMRSGREAFIHEVAKAFRSMYPAKYRYITAGIKRLNQVVSDSSTGRRGKERHLFFQIRVPTELMLFIQRWLPDFGRDHKDIELLQRCWPDLAHKDRRIRRRMYVSREMSDIAHTKEEPNADRPAEGR